ncbi:hypothetical protein HK414_26840 [Ramlibacter terrae]|uniref:Uncharacterized protein n=1 Tax=Ramlibacter terrae TaxID=2732511 RepID=A0ABX6P672_9BURK|nr:hypothetical protein HK414_26840 [Ramlibacter terrae]
MSKQSMSLSIVFAAALATAGIAHAQKAAETTNVPQRAGEASTMTGGAPNATTSNAPGTTTARPANVNTGKTGETSNVPQRAGEASTMTGGAPNAKTSNAPGTTTDKKTSKMGNKSDKMGSKTDKMGAGGKAAAAETSNTPQRPGEASTMTGGAPNAKTTN